MTVFDNQTVEEQKAWEHYQKVEAENFHLKKQLANLRKENKVLKHHNRALIGFKRKVEAERKERYRNDGKKRTKRSRTI